MQENDWNCAMDNTVVFPVDVKAQEDGFEITALLPGVKVDDLDIQVVDETVVIKGELKSERDEKGQYLLAERPSGCFSRVLNLSTALNPAEAKARIDNGVLTLWVPKSEFARPRTIKVSVN